ncbi:MAG: P-type conjugative transfer protein TrbJ [Sphingomicrobium sp.]
MKAISMAALLAGSAVAIGAIALPAAPAIAIPVFDSANYAQNLVQAARALEQINHQVESLQNEAAMLRNMARNLDRIDFPELEQVTSAMNRIDELMGQARAIDFNVDALDQRVRAMFPGAAGGRLSRDERVAAARDRLDAASAGYRQAIEVQAQVAENVREDAALLAELARRSQGSSGSLQVQQAANQLAALSVKQQFQLQQLMAAEFRGAAIERARRAQAEEEGRAATRRFLGTGPAYAPRAE